MHLLHETKNSSLFFPDEEKKLFITLTSKNRSYPHTHRRIVHIVDNQKNFSNTLRKKNILKCKKFFFRLKLSVDNLWTKL